MIRFAACGAASLLAIVLCSMLTIGPVWSIVAGLVAGVVGFFATKDLK